MNGRKLGGFEDVASIIPRMSERSLGHDSEESITSIERNFTVFDSSIPVATAYTGRYLNRDDSKDTLPVPVERNAAD